MEDATRDRLFSALLLLLVAAGAFFGIAPFVAPTEFADLTGFAGRDLLVFRLAGAATFCNAVGLAAGYRASWTELRVPIASTAVFNLGSIFACVLAIIGGGAQPVVYVILLASLLFSSSCLYFLARPPTGRRAAPAEDDRGFAPWITALFAVGTASAIFFGVLGLVLAGSFGRTLGYPGFDDFAYRQAGAATLGAGVGGMLVLLDRRWVTARIPAVMALTFNGLAVSAVLLDIGAGTARPVAYVILAAAALVAAGAAVALVRRGR